MQKCLQCLQITSVNKCILKSTPTKHNAKPVLRAAAWLLGPHFLHSASCRVPQKDTASVKGASEDSVLVVISEFRDGGPMVLVRPPEKGK